MGKKILVPCLDVIMIAFSSLVLEIWSFTVYFSGKRRSKIQTKCAHAPWASYNTPQIELIQYGRRIGKKVYCRLFLSSKTEKKIQRVNGTPRRVCCKLTHLFQY